MKKLLFLLLVIAAFTTKAQNIQLDTPSNIAYAEIKSIPITWLKGEPMVNRLYIQIADFNLVNSTGFNWWLKYPVFIDDNTVVYQSIMNGSATIHVNTGATIDDAAAYIFNWVADSINLQISFRK